MRIDPKYFNFFLVVVAILAAGMISFFTLSNRSEERTDFRERIMAQDSLKAVWWPRVQTDDSLRISDFQGQYVVLDLWSNWSSGVTGESHGTLAELKRNYSDSLQVIAAAVGLQKQEVLDYIQEKNYPFQFVAGSRHFSSFNVPGLPAQIIYDRKGHIQHVFLGYPGESQYDSLRVLLENGQ